MVVKLKMSLIMSGNWTLRTRAAPLSLATGEPGLCSLPAGTLALEVRTQAASHLTIVIFISSQLPCRRRSEHVTIIGLHGKLAQ